MCSDGGISHASILHMKGQFRKISHTNTASAPLIQTTCIPTQKETSFISKKWNFWVHNIVIYHLQKAITKMHSSLLIAFFNYLNLSIFIGQ
jgi:hypothetical protein